MKIKKRIKAIILIPITFSGLNALEFGGIGNLSPSMGGAGVALKNAFGLYYNPALLSSNGKTKFGYSIGANISEKNFSNFASIDIDNMKDTATDLGKQFGGGSSALGASTPVKAYVLPSKSLVASTSSTSAKALSADDGFLKALKDALKATNAADSTGSTSSTSTSEDLGDLWKKFKENPKKDSSKLVNELKKAISSSSMPLEQKNFFNTLSSGIDFNNFDASSGSISKIVIKKGSNPNLDKTMEDMKNIFETLKQNSFNGISQNGIVLSIFDGGLEDSFGSLAFGIFQNIQATGSLKADPNKLGLIFGSGSDYYKLTVDNDKFIFQKSTQEEYNNKSLIKSLEEGHHKFVASGFILNEVPIGYSKSIYTYYFNMSFGVALKYMNAMSNYREIPLTKEISAGDFKSIATFSSLSFANSVGVDLGFMLELDMPTFTGLSAGLVAKNINYPTFKFNNSRSITIEPQYRAGIAYNGDIYSLALDIDILKNEVLSYSNNKVYSQTIGGGTMIDFKVFDLRLGAKYDFRKQEGIIITTGFNILGVLDVALESGTNFFKFKGYTIPKYAGIRIGGNFSF